MTDLNLSLNIQSGLTLINDIKFFPQTESVNFIYLSKLWQGYYGNNSPYFIPQLLIHYFHKVNIESMQELKYKTS